MARLVFPIIALVLLGAHFVRNGPPGLAAACLAAVPMLFSRRGWVPSVFKGGLILGSFVWIAALSELIGMRRALGAPWLRMAIILAGVALFTFIAQWPFWGRWAERRYSRRAGSATAGAAAFFLTAGLLALIQRMAPFPLLLLERFVPGGGWLELLLLSFYAAWVVEKLQDPAAQPAWRLRVWLLFSLVFFAQLGLGLLGSERFLMTGDLHLPVPALIVAGPVYRGHGFFMPLLFAATLVLAGPAWCSHLCYIGAWDNLAARGRRRPRALPRWRHLARLAILISVVIIAAACRWLGAPPGVAGALAVAFGGIGLLVMIFLSRKWGTMAHCTVYCPIGLVADRVGRVNPFRIHLQSGCTKCGKCANACRFDALSAADIERRRPGLTCTLCGDCVGSCKDGQITYRLGPLKKPAVRTAFIVIISVLHAVFMGVARM